MLSVVLNEILIIHKFIELAIRVLFVNSLFLKFRWSLRFKKLILCKLPDSKVMKSFFSGLQIFLKTLSQNFSTSVYYPQNQPETSHWEWLTLCEFYAESFTFSLTFPRYMSVVLVFRELFLTISYSATNPDCWRQN